VTEEHTVSGRGRDRDRGGQFLAVRKRLRDSWNGSVTLAKKDAQCLLDEIVWLKRRLRRVEYAIEPLMDMLTRL
jgi:hypothetical protein